ncbi:sensor histidine kinase [Planobispora longispora]|uniref:sensor histidine kinase n=1 Tax=Planobispora longispora TaxID=28887 RepID=UPI001EF664C1|nr:sensor histidine kinase [Planobispora longispora]
MAPHSDQRVSSRSPASAAAPDREGRGSADAPGRGTPAGSPAPADVPGPEFPRVLGTDPADRLLRVAALVLSPLCVLAAAGGVWAGVRLGEAVRPDPIAWPSWSSVAAGLILVASGAVLVHRLPRHPVAWLLLGGAVVACAGGFCAAYAALSVVRHGGDLPFTAAALFVGGRSGPLQNLIVPLVLLLFPDGRLPSPRWRLPAGAALGCVGLVILILFTVPWRIISEGDPPFPGLTGIELDPVTPALPDPVWQATRVIIVVLLLTSVAIPVAAFAARFRGSGPELRVRLRWMLFAALVNLVITALVFAVRPYLPGAPEALWPACLGVLALAVLVAVARHRLYDVDLLLGRTILYGGLAVAVVAVDTAVFVGAGALVDDPLAAVIGAGAVGILYAPLRLRIQRWTDRVLNGRSDPYDVVSALAERLEESVGPDELLREVARVLSTAFRSPYVRVELDRPGGGTYVVEHGIIRRDDVVVLPFAYREAQIGRLALVPRVGPRLSDADQRLLADVLRQAAAAARATALTEELQRSREQLVTGIAEERRRLRRDLHDGLGPLLAGAALKIEAARNLAGRDLPAANAALDDVRGDLSAMLADVRRLVHGLRPPALDQFGLAGAVERQAAGFAGGSLEVAVHIEGGLPGLPAAVEVAAYRIIAEALANVSRHARATTCAVRLAAVRGALEAEVTDDGRGLPPGSLSGVGLVAMRERAEELGGRCTVAARPDGGTRVHAVIPYGTIPHGRGPVPDGTVPGPG